MGGLLRAFLPDNRIVPHCRPDRTVRLVPRSALVLRVTIRYRPTLHFQWKTVLVDPSDPRGSSIWSVCQPRPFCWFRRADSSVGTRTTPVSCVPSRKAAVAVFVHGCACCSAYPFCFSR